MEAPHTVPPPPSEKRSTVNLSPTAFVTILFIVALVSICSGSGRSYRREFRRLNEKVDRLEKKIDRLTAAQQQKKPGSAPSGAGAKRAR